jgi:hypothetical protein
MGTGEKAREIRRKKLLAITYDKNTYKTVNNGRN